MLRFFRTIRKKLIEEDNVRKYLLYAVGEILLVVIGILLALQVNNWNEERKNLAKEKEYLGRLHADAITAVQRQQNALRWNEERARTQSVVLAALRSGNLTDNQREDFSAGLAHAGSLNPLIWQWGTVEELYSTGNIRIIRNNELRELLSATETNYKRAREIIDDAKQRIHVSHGQISRSFDTVTYGYSPGDRAIVKFDFDSLAIDKKFVAAFSNLHLNSMRISTFAVAHLESLEELEAGVARARGLEPLIGEGRAQQ